MRVRGRGEGGKGREVGGYYGNVTMTTGSTHFADISD